MADVETWHLALLGLAVFAGAAVQGVVGLGVALVTAPVAGLLEPALLPGLPLWLALVYPFLTLSREWSDIDWRGLGWALPARIFGTGIGAALVANVSDSTLGIVVGTMVLLVIVTTVWTFEVRPSPKSLVGAGFLSGITGTATSIGGPPFAVLYQHRPPDQLRATLAIFFIAGAALSLTGLSVAGGLHVRDLAVAGVLLPVMLAGFGVSLVVRGRLVAAHVRVAMLTVCATSATLLVVRSAL